MRGATQGCCRAGSASGPGADGPVGRLGKPARGRYDKAEHRVELTATVSEAVADAFENARALQAEGSSVVVTDIAGARFVPRYHPRIIERVALVGLSPNISLCSESAVQTAGAGGQHVELPPLGTLVLRLCIDGMQNPEQEKGRLGDSQRAISRSVVTVLKEHLGRGPIKAKTYLHDDWVLVLMYNGHTVAEVTLEAGGQAESVASQRVKASEAIRSRLTAIVEAETGRKVIGFMSSSQQEPSLLNLVFVLDSSDLIPSDDA